MCVFIMETIDMECFINEIRKRPALWDCSTDDYKNRQIKNEKWTDLTLFFFPDLENNLQDRMQMGKELRMKWRHIRDAYIRNRRLKYNYKQSGITGKPIKPYIYAKQLYFIKTDFKTDPEETVVSLQDDVSNPSETLMPIEDVTYNSTETLMPLEYDHSEPPENLMTLEYITPHHTEALEDAFKDNEASRQSTEEVEMYVPRLTRRKGRRKKPNLDQKIEHYMDTIQKQSVRRTNLENSDDMSFFRSLLPTIQTLKNVDKLKFRVDVMNLLISYSETEQNFEQHQENHNPTFTHHRKTRARKLMRR